MSAGMWPMMVPHFDMLRRRGMKRSHIAVYGAVVAFDAIGMVPTAAQIAELAGLNAACKGRDAQRALVALVAAGLLTKVTYMPNLTRYVVRGPRLPSYLDAQPANDNGIPAD